MKKVVLSYIGLYLILGISSAAYAKIQETTWTPDTCDCQIVYTWDDSVSADQRTHTVKTINRHDPAYSSMTASSEFQSILDENQRKNKVYGQLLTFTALTKTVTQKDGSIATVFKDDKGFTYSFSGTPPNRTINITITAGTLTTQQKSTAQSWCDSNIGVGKVVIN